MHPTGSEGSVALIVLYKGSLNVIKSLRFKIVVTLAV